MVRTRITESIVIVEHNDEKIEILENEDGYTWGGIFVAMDDLKALIKALQDIQEKRS